MTSKGFAEEMGINYRTALNWLRDGLVPGAVEEDTPIGRYWKIPRTALEMEKPMKPGPKKGSKRVQVSTATTAPDDGAPAAAIGEEKPAAKRRRKK